MNTIHFRHVSKKDVVLRKLLPILVVNKNYVFLGAEILNEKIQHFEVTEQVQLIAPAKTPQKKRILCNP